jgi:isochorismate hydrolase
LSELVDFSMLAVRQSFAYAALNHCASNIYRCPQATDRRRHGLITGLATDFCVARTALDALRAGLATYVVEDACRGIDVGGSLARRDENPVNGSRSLT